MLKTVLKSEVLVLHEAGLWTNKLCLLLVIKAMDSLSSGFLLQWKWSENASCSAMSDFLRPHGLYRPWNSPGQNTWVSSLSLLQGIFPTQRSNRGLLHCRQILYQLSHKGSPRILEWVAYPFSSGSSHPGIEPGSPALQVYSLPTELSGKPSPMTTSSYTCGFTLSLLAAPCWIFATRLIILVLFCCSQVFFCGLEVLCLLSAFYGTIEGLYRYFGGHSLSSRLPWCFRW